MCGVSWQHKSVSWSWPGCVMLCHVTCNATSQPSLQHTLHTHSIHNIWLMTNGQLQEVLGELYVTQKYFLKNSYIFSLLSSVLREVLFSFVCIHKVCRNWDPFKTDYIFQSSGYGLDQRGGDRLLGIAAVYGRQGPGSGQGNGTFVALKYEVTSKSGPGDFSLGPSSIKLVTSKTIYILLSSRPAPSQSRS